MKGGESEAEQSPAVKQNRWRRKEMLHKAEGDEEGV